MLHYPDRALVDAALAAVPFVVVSELFMTETAERANLILPACSSFEKSGTTTDLAGDVLPVVGSVVAPGEAQADGDMLVLLAQALDVALPDPVDMESSIVSAGKKAPSDGRPLPPGAGVTNTGEYLRLVIESTIFSGGGTVAFDPRINELRTEPYAKLHPQTAAALHIGDGDQVDIVAANGDGALPGLTARLSERVPPGAVAVVDGVPEAPANAFDAGSGVRVTAVQAAAATGA
jgi:NADH-quinone oxidoreductase subunit G